MVREIGSGLLGVGWMGDRLVIAADADDVEARARLAVPRLGYERWTTDWREVVDHPDVEAVSITAPNHMHREMALAAARAGKHFWGEKPLGRFPAETAEIAAAVEQAGILTTVGLNDRHVPAVLHARELIRSGALGGINHYRCHFVAGYAAHPQAALSWRFLRASPGSCRSGQCSWTPMRSAGARRAASAERGDSRAVCEHPA